MKLGLISDVHGDPVALELAWAHMTTMGASRILCAGDVVGYGPRPDEVAAFLRRFEIPSVRGNHDRWCLERATHAPDPFGGGMPSATTRDYLATLPESHAFEVNGRIVVVVHGSIRDDMEYVTRKDHPPALLRGWLEMIRADVLVVGHTHQAMWCETSRGLVVNPGSVVSAPVVGTSRTFAVVETDDLSVTFHDVESGEVVAVEPWLDR